MDDKQNLQTWHPDAHSAFCSEASALLYKIGINPNHMLYWIMLAVADITKQDPVFYITGIRCRLYPEISARLGLSEAAIDRRIRRAAEEYSKGKYRLMREYMPAGVERPTASEFLAAWLRMAALQENGNE